MSFLSPQNLLSFLMGEKKAKFYLNQAGKRLFIAIRLNPLKADPKSILAFLSEDGFKFTSLPFYPFAYKIEYEPFSISKSVLHFAGLIYLQDPSSMLPPLVLNPRPGEKVLDLTAAPGSKTTLMATLMENKGVLVAIDSSKKRLKALSYNLKRWGIINTGWARLLGEQVGNLFFETFDKVLVDPPCSALGTLHKSPEVLRLWKEAKVIKLSRIQERLLISGLKALKPGGTLVYSTCTLTPHENEAVIDAILERYPVKIEKIKLPPGFNPSSGLTKFLNFSFSNELENTVRLYPLDNPGEGFFIAKLKKIESFLSPSKRFNSVKEDWQLYMSFKEIFHVFDHFGIPLNTFPSYYFLKHNTIRLTNKDMAEFVSPISLQKGISFARPMGKTFRLTTNGITFLAPFIKKNRIELDRYSLKMLLSGHPLPAPPNHIAQQLITHLNCPLGYGWVKEGKLLNQFPIRSFTPII